MTIWKFPVIITDLFELEMPAGAEILSVQIQNGVPQLWAVVDENAKKVFRTFYVRGTGHSTDGLEHAKFVGTFQMCSGALVFHLFSGGER